MSEFNIVKELQTTNFLVEIKNYLLEDNVVLSVIENEDNKLELTSDGSYVKLNGTDLTDSLEIFTALALFGLDYQVNPIGGVSAMSKDGTQCHRTTGQRNHIYQHNHNKLVVSSTKKTLRLTRVGRETITVAMTDSWEVDLVGLLAELTVD